MMDGAVEHSFISILSDSVVIYTLKYYEVQQREEWYESRSSTGTIITSRQNENKKIRID